MYRAAFEGIDSEMTVQALDLPSLKAAIVSTEASLTAAGHQLINSENYTIPNPSGTAPTGYIGKVYYRKKIIC